MTTTQVNADLLLAAAAVLGAGVTNDYTRKLAADLTAAAGEVATDALAAERRYQAQATGVTVEVKARAGADLTALLA